MSNIELVALIVRDYDAAIAFFVDILQFEMVEDTPSLTNDGCPKRWVVVRPQGGRTGLLLARADGERQPTLWGISSRDASACSSAWMTSSPPISAWRRLECDSCQRHAKSHTADLPCSWTSKGIVGI
jgi:hypothetical protein